MFLLAVAVFVTDEGGLFTVLANAKEVGIIPVRTENFIPGKHGR